MRSSNVSPSDKRLKCLWAYCPRGMTYEIPQGADATHVADVEEIHEVLLNRRGYDAENVEVTLDLHADEITVRFGEDVGLMD